KSLDGIEDLFGKLPRYVRLAPSALGEEALEVEAWVRAVCAARMEEKLQGERDRTARGVDQVVHAEREMRGRLAGRRMDDSEGAAVGDEADGDARVAEEPLKLSRGRIAPGSRGVLGRV